MQSKLNKIWEKILASVLVVALTAGNLMLIGSNLISYAGENLEAQDEKTEHTNVEFGVYFESEGKKVHSLVCDAEANEKIYIHLNVKDGGYLKNGKIEIVDANYKVIGEIEESNVIGNIKENIFELKQINYGTEALLEVPIQLEVGEKFNIDNINKNSKVKLIGTYVTSEGQEVKIEKEVALNIAWESTAEIEVKSKLNTYRTYKIEEAKEVIIQEEIEVNAIEASLPIQSTRIEITVPTYKGEEPKAVRVNSKKTEMTNGKTYGNVELDWNYNKETGKVTIEVNNEEENGMVWSKKDGIDEYVITYEYVEKETAEIETNIERKANIEVTVYSNNENNTVEKTIEKIETLTTEIGNVISGDVEIKEEINKAKIYANYNSNNKEYETKYEEREIISIAKAEIVADIVIEEQEETFIVSEEEEKSLTVEDVDYTYYKNTKIAVENFNKILGVAGSISIEDESGEIGKIDSTTEVVDGYYVLTYIEKPENIKIMTSKPITEGDLIVEHEKSIKADLAYSKEVVKGFNAIKITKQVGQSSDEAKQAIEGIQKLTEAKNYLNLISNKESINQNEETIELRLEFGNDEESSILYSNPTVKIKLPQFIDIEEVEKINAEILFDEELEVVDKEIISGERTIQIKLEGTQTKFNTIANANGATLVVGASVNCKESGEGEIVAEIEGNTARTKIISYLNEEENKEDIDAGTIDSNNNIEELTEEQKARISISMKSPMENVNLKEGEDISYIIKVNNLNENIHDDVEIKDIVVKNFLPSEVSFKEATLKTYNTETNNYEEVQDGATYDAKNRVVVWNVGNMLYEPEASLILKVTINELDEGIYQKEISNTAIASYEGINNISSNTVKIAVVKPKINITKLTENILSVNKTKDIIKLIVKAENVGALEDDVNLKINIPEGLEPISIKFGKNNQIINRTNTSSEIELEKVTLASGETYMCEVSATIDAIKEDYKEQYKIITPKAIINNQEMNWTIKVENPNYTESSPDLPDEPITPENPDKQETYTITGNAWLDENKNGVKEEGEQKLKDIKVSIMSNNNILKETTTNADGMYSFEGLEKGNYQIIFNYNGDTYKVAEYRKTGEIEINSSAIAGEKGEAITDIVKIVDKDIVHINLGLVKIPEFDMSISKKISRIIIQNNEGTKEYEYDSNLAKADINAKYLNGSVVLVEYKITIKNEGELAGRVKKIVDYIPKDMTFSTDVNRTWVQGADGNLYNSELKDIDIAAGETKEITLILKKKMTEENTGIINNTAEIAEVENSENIKDKDSTPNNRVQGEDDMSSADVLLGVRTGAEVVYYTLTIVILIILATGMYLINKKVLKG